MPIHIANLSAVVTGALEAAKAVATEMLPAAVTRDAIVEASRASVAWLTSHLWARLAVARAITVDNLPAGAAAIHIANLSAVVTGALEAAKAVATEMLPAAVTRDAVVEASRASVAWLTSHLWAWLAVARAVTVDNLPAGAAAIHIANLSAVVTGALEAAVTRGRCHRDAPGGRDEGRRRRGVESLGGMAHEPPLGLAGRGEGPASTAGWPPRWSRSSRTSPPRSCWAAWLVHGRGGGVAVYATLALALLAVAFLVGAVWAFTCRSMKGPGLGGARVPRAVFEANPKRYYATVRTARKAQRRAGGAGCKLLLVGLLVAFAAYLAAKMLY
ncbi:unnamed protein product [Miscanthus lutarioriparius]|uniref:Uncharacterized protein n=1 Tax=Miscanthus lutarioriparius TaxID=422564 RepID=A0A811MC26_9POAL|nr:unnamed protein product [Miscanthus lutarioriparius]